jgi:hypothetical protein
MPEQHYSVIINWRVLRLWMEKTVCRYEEYSSYKYIEPFLTVKLLFYLFFVWA